MADDESAPHPADLAAEHFRAGGTVNDLPAEVRADLLWLWCADEDGESEARALAWIDLGVVDETMPLAWEEVGITNPFLVRSGALLDREPHEFRDPAALRAVLLTPTLWEHLEADDT